MTKIQSENEFPEEFNNYVTLEEELEVPITIVSVGRTGRRRLSVDRFL